MIQQEYSDPEKTLLLVESDPNIADLLIRLLQEMHVEILYAENRKRALQVAKSEHFQAMIINSWLYDGSGVALYDILHTMPHFKQAPVLILTTQFNSIKYELDRRGIEGYEMPFDLSAFLLSIYHLLDYSTQQ